MKKNGKLKTGKKVKKECFIDYERKKQSRYEQSSSLVRYVEKI